MKVMDIQYITYYTDNQYQLITIHGAGYTLIHIVLSKTLTKYLLKQKDKPNSIKTGVYCIKQSTILPNRNYHYMTSNLINEWMKNKEEIKGEYKGEKKEKKKGEYKEDDS